MIMDKKKRLWIKKNDKWITKNDLKYILLYILDE